ncbi:hypothetical protein N5P37_003684 [Trichoderma harzianum]|uniref:Uncharacterized protein n=1 Tax=Trichoderma harzianum CBS 226.95 TaxID=983964 RepID=A0A2T4AV84_TRIHA|nr:hypothetical protein M431DRAFT_477378 [Trichoderma harzianum CBS 226.95]KAK0764285.1 hypothetical protein N5P37_003684 [Trichoderma harzianum]PKK52824.1 hypothetical protein CI102_1796 [Trichoderma harzianum]PTB60977.1 hypothetical protein M431DRAFT_477378 [Trichoderma harzianum CBS 226.95]
MAFYDTVRNPRDFSRKASDESAKSFQNLLGSGQWKTAGSSWGVEHLFACRVICSKPTSILPVIKATVDALRMQRNEWDPVIKKIIQGPNEGKSTLGSMLGEEVLQLYNNDTLGHIWTALSPLVKPEPVPMSDRQLRERNPSQSAESQGSPESLQISTPSATESNASSIGYYEAEWAPRLKALTVEFVSLFIRHVLAFCQPRDKVSKITYRHGQMEHKSDALRLFAIDDAGLQVSNQDGRVFQVALLEAERTFQTIRNGRPTISDGLLGQLAGEALGTIASGSSIFRNKVFIILAIKHFVKFLEFSVSEQFMSQFKTRNPADRENWDTYLLVDSTEWFDATSIQGRGYIVSHVMVLVECADDVVSR